MDWIKLVAFDMYRTCLHIQGEEEHIPLLSSILNVDRRILSQVFLTVDEPLETSISLLNVDQADSLAIETIFKPKVKKSLENILLFPETMNTLETLKKKGYAIAVVSNVSADFVAPIQKYFPSIFDYEILSCKEGVKKPQKEIFELLIERSWYKADEIIMVWDSLESDVGWAKNIGINAVLIDRTAEGIEQCNWYTKISSLDQVIELLK